MTRGHEAKYTSLCEELLHVRMHACQTQPTMCDIQPSVLTLQCLLIGGTHNLQGDVVALNEGS